MSGRNLSRDAVPDDAESLALGLREARAFLLAAAAEVPEERWAQAPSPAYSPVGWHLGHAAATQARWLLPGDADAARYGKFFDPFLTEKRVRSALPAPAELRAFLASVGERAEERLLRGDLPRAPGPQLPASFLAQHLAQHELQHGEHLRVVSALLERRLHRPGRATAGAGAGQVTPAGEVTRASEVPAAEVTPERVVAGDEVTAAAGRVEFAGGEARLGSDDAAEAYDNERPAHAARVAPFWLDRAPVTVAEYAQFVEAGGYAEARLWSEEGWAWRLRESISAPAGWERDGARFAHPDGARAAQHPVTCVSWFEADAYARFRGARLPTEQEWEHAQSAGSAVPRRFAHGHAPAPAEANVAGARRGTSPVDAFAPAPCGLLDAAGNVWEWTASWFGPYAGFAPYPYDGYSTPWFGTHRVLRGGSWATAPRLCRIAFRNWYEPGFREIPAGLRCAGSIP